MRRLFTVILFVVMASLDNTVLALLPISTPRVRQALGVSNQALGLLIGANLAVVAITGLAWGYRSDQVDRRRLLILGTLSWVIPTGLIVVRPSYGSLFILMLLAGVGLGGISTVGYSVITDLISHRWRGLMLGVWGLAQGIGGLSAGIIVGVLPPDGQWYQPFGVLALVGLLCSGLALFALSPPKGAADSSIVSDERITLRDVPIVLSKPVNRWLMAQGFLAQFTYGSLVWLTVLLTAKLTVQGVALEHANSIAALLGVVVQVGGVVSLWWGWFGDRLQRHNGRARGLIAAYGFWFAVPCYTVLFWSPLPLEGTLQGSALDVVATQLRQNGWWWVALVAATLAIVAQATNAPNWFALLSEVNLPEHRGTAFSFVALANSIGRALGTIVVSASFDWLQRRMSGPTPYALGLTVFQLFFIPAGLCFWLAGYAAPYDLTATAATLRRRSLEEHR